MFLACFGRGLSKDSLGKHRASILTLDTSAPRQEAEGPNRLCHDASKQPGCIWHENNGAHPRHGKAREPMLNAPSSASSTRNGLNASRIESIQPENVTLCNANEILDGICLRQRELGRGTFGIVVPGTFKGLNCAVKIMLSAGLDDRTALRELLLSPRLVHPNVVSTYASRCAHLTNNFFDILEGERSVDRDPNQPRVLESTPFKSEDGFGDPKDLHDGSDPLVVLHQILHALGAETGKMMVLIVQEYCERGTLENAICKNIFKSSMPWGVRLARRAMLRTAADIARGLLHLHDSDVVHGDLKPANVLLGTSREDRRGFVAKVADFGLAHVLPSAASSLYTDSWGSIAYMAPEAFNGKVSRAMDVWAFGVCLWQMLTGERPYSGHRYAEVVLGVKNGSMTLSWPEEEPMTSNIIELGRLCLSFHPSDRPAFDVVVQRLVEIEREIRAELLSQQQQQRQQKLYQDHQHQQALLQQGSQRPAGTSGVAPVNVGELPASDRVSELVEI